MEEISEIIHLTFLYSSFPSFSFYWHLIFPENSPIQVANSAKRDISER